MFAPTRSQLFLFVVLRAQGKQGEARRLLRRRLDAVAIFDGFAEHLKATADPDHFRALGVRVDDGVRQADATEMEKIAYRIFRTEHQDDVGLPQLFCAFDEVQVNVVFQRQGIDVGRIGDVRRNGNGDAQRRVHATKTPLAGFKGKPVLVGQRELLEVRDDPEDRAPRVSFDRVVRVRE